MKNNLKVRTVTFHRALNNGATLQAYALCKYLRDEGYDCKVMNYLPKNFLLQTYRPAKGVSKSISKFKKLLRFRDFWKKFLPVTSKTYFNDKSLVNDDDTYAYICGSDQVWNKAVTSNKNDNGYFLNFETKKARKIAYAASSGGASLLDDSVDVVSKLKNFHSIGVREDSLAKEISTLSEVKNATVVLDPSLLIKDYSEVECYDRVPDYDFLLTYAVGSGDTLNFFDEHVRVIKDVISLPVVHIGAKNITSADFTILNIGPQDWVAFFKKAKFIVTNSFHGTAFSINFGKQFYSISHLKDGLNHRQRTLLTGVGLEDRLLSDFFNDAEVKEIEYSEVDDKLEALVLKSKEFLINSLN